MSRYTAFTDNNVFANPAINLVGNKIYEEIIKQFPAADLATTFVVTGKTSRIAQNEATGDAPNLAFITSDADVFSHLSKNAKAFFSPESLVFLKNTLQFKKYGFFFEIHLDTAISITSVLQDGLYLHETSKIPSNIL